MATVPSLRSLAIVASKNADMVRKEIARGDLYMAEGYAILLEQQSALLRQGITDEIRAHKGASP